MTTKLNVRGDSPHAYSDQDEVRQWEATQWLIDYVEDNNDVNDAAWSDWSDPDHVIDAYEPAIGEESGKLTSYDPDGSEEPLRRITIGEQGREVLAASIAGKDPEPLMNQWSQDIQEASEAPSP
ncbi:hypothetical protein [Sulfitobacter sp. 15WGC]|uniref:hypothetical protein n=1 Tax=Sulfitobacter sp. 15WGC TaxID=2575437 RepID=UPI0010ABCCA7|nr:hypothetical protein [Sulfitobacter sp. 15WGC]TKA84381.1 hypothetical protein FCK22_16200 [Sulfitobacter sp. 15WGC]